MSWRTVSIICSVRFADRLPFTYEAATYTAKNCAPTPPSLSRAMSVCGQCLDGARPMIESFNGTAGNIVMRIDEQRRAMHAHHFRIGDGLVLGRGLAAR